MNGDPTMFDPLRCFYVARATGEDPLVVLRAAGKADLAEVIELLWGRALTEREAIVLRAFRNMTPDVARSWSMVCDDIIEAATVPGSMSVTSAIHVHDRHYVAPARKTRRSTAAKRRLG